MKTKIIVVCHSSTGRTAKLAEAIARGAGGEIMAVDNISWEKLDAADAIIFGSPTYMGGEDDLAVVMNELGACGTISVTSNVAPKLCAQMQELSLAGKIAEANAIQEKLMPLHSAMFCETSPGPVKYAAKLLGLCDGSMKLPLVEIAAESKKKVEAAMSQIGLI